MKRPEKMVLYNLFPTLAGKATQWNDHFKRASEMGFNWIFVNPIQAPGTSGSLYSIKDYFSINPKFVDPKSTLDEFDQISAAVKSAKKLGLNMMVDLVISHTSTDAELIKKHPEWYMWDNGRVANPFCYEDGRKVVWQDLAQFDNRHTRDPEGLFQFYMKIMEFLIGLGFTGFRCDAAYQVPKNIWSRLIKESNKIKKGLVFVAETLGCTSDQTRECAGAGFEYIFNSSKWWDYTENWLMAQYNLTHDIVKSISFPESHDTPRLSDELNGNVEGLKQRFLFSSIFSSGVMVPSGYEFGFKKKLHVVNTRETDWEQTDIDITSFIKEVNQLKQNYSIFNEEVPTEILNTDNPNILLLWKGSTSSYEEFLLILNKDIYNKQNFYSDNLKKYVQAGAPLKDISPEYRLDFIPEPFTYDLRPGQGIVLVTQRDTNR